MADAKDILAGCSRPGHDSTGSSEKRRNNKESHKKPDGVSREVYSLLGGVPPMMPSFETDLKKHVHEPTDLDTKLGWRFVPFSSSARRDHLQLHHWERVMLEKETPEESHTRPTQGFKTVPVRRKGEGSMIFPPPDRPKYRVVVGPPKDYPFAKFNQVVDMIRYTDEEYAGYLEDSDWTREDTDKLFDMCEQFDLRFIVIADRFPTPRTVEELKNRYYSVAKTILERRAMANNQDEIADHMLNNVYDCEYEVQRKKTLGIFLSQSRRQDREDDELLDEARLIREERYKEKLARKARLTELTKISKLRETEKREEGNPAATQKKSGNEGVIGSSSATTTRPRRPSPVPRTQASQISPSRVGSQIAATKLESPGAFRSSTTAVEGNQNVSGGVPVAAAATDDVLGSKVPGVFLRSQRHAKNVKELSSQVGTRTARRIGQMIAKHNCSPNLKVFTEDACAMHMELRKELHELLKLEESIRSVEAEIKTLKTPPKSSGKTSPGTSPRRSQHGAGAPSVSDANPSSGERVSKRERRKSVRIMEQ